MQRHAALDPPEYVQWTPDPGVARDYRERVCADPERERIIRALSEFDLLELYSGLVRNRLHDLVLKRWVRGGVISKAWLGTGEEASTIGPVHALRRQAADGDIVAPMIRNAGACHEMGMPVADMLRGYLGTSDSPSGGRDGHVGDPRHGVITPISHLADMVPVAAGIALAFRLRGEDRVVLTWVGDGSTKTTGFHEGINLAAVQRLPLVCIVQNNQVALGTRLERHMAGTFAKWPRMYGARGSPFDGNHVLDACAAARISVERARAGEGVMLLVAETFRMGGHATHDEREARRTFAPELFRHWGRRDPIGLYETWLEEQGIGRERLQRVESEAVAEVDAAEQEALRSRRSAMPNPAAALGGVYGTSTQATQGGDAR